MQIRQRRTNEALIEFIVDVTTQADRSGKALQYAELYEASDLRRENDGELGLVTLQTSDEMQRTTEVSFWRCHVLQLLYGNYVPSMQQVLE